MNGGMILLPYLSIHFTHFAHKRYIPIKTIASALILCKNNAMNIFH